MHGLLLVAILVLGPARRIAEESVLRVRVLRERAVEKVTLPPPLPPPPVFRRPVPPHPQPAAQPRVLEVEPPPPAVVQAEPRPIPPPLFEIDLPPPAPPVPMPAQAPPVPQAPVDPRTPGNGEKERSSSARPAEAAPAKATPPPEVSEPAKSPIASPAEGASSGQAPAAIAGPIGEELPSASVSRPTARVNVTPPPDALEPKQSPTLSGPGGASEGQTSAGTGLAGEGLPRASALRSGHPGDGKGPGPPSASPEAGTSTAPARGIYVGSAGGAGSGRTSSEIADPGIGAGGGALVPVEETPGPAVLKRVVPEQDKEAARGGPEAELVVGWPPEAEENPPTGVAFRRCFRSSGDRSSGPGSIQRRPAAMASREQWISASGSRQMDLSKPCRSCALPDPAFSIRPRSKRSAALRRILSFGVGSASPCPTVLIGRRRVSPLATRSP